MKPIGSWWYEVPGMVTIGSTEVPDLLNMF